MTVIRFVTLLCILHSCCTLKNYDYTILDCQDVHREAIDVSIRDYNKNVIKKRKNSNVAVQINVVCTSTEWFLVFFTPWEHDADKFPMAVLLEYKNQIPPSWIPTEYVENMGTLYAWHNPQKAVTEDVISVLTKYHLVHNQEEWTITTGEGGLYYIFCKSNNQKFYKRVTRDWGVPLPSCNCHDKAHLKL